ncbi:MAG: GTPase Era [Microbacteriaceae bacterium]|jgi:GTP-binding protein Era|nr:GTPase Era [Microbacteriaceae bacterium]MCI1206803.1 GTPase Era [Microbacteriaceae bacterium]
MTGASEHRAGFIALLGRPNVGKSTLMNALVGAKIAITTDRPETTRKAIRGILTTPDAQLIFVDTPGVHRPRTLLGQRLNDTVSQVMAEVDVIAVCFPADEKIGPGDRRIVASLAQWPRAARVAVVTKTDTVRREALAPKLVEVDRLTEWTDVVPVSAEAGSQLGELTEVLSQLLPRSPELYPAGQRAEETPEEHIAELLREALISELSAELPHSVAVVVEEMSPREERPGLVDVHASVYVERSSQKAIIIGRAGARLRQSGTRAREQIEAYLGKRVYLDVRVKVAREWQTSPKELGRLGF